MTGLLRIFVVISALTLALPGAAQDSEYGEYTYSDQGLYRVLMYPEDGDAPIGQLHSWIVRVETEAGSPIVPTQLVIQGGMPGHGHGLPSKPQVTDYLEDGEFRIQGMKFNMAGRWQLVLGVTGPDGPDQVVHEYHLQRAAVPNQEPVAINWTVAELALMNSLALSSQTPAQADPSNRFSQNANAAELGELLFFDPKLSVGGDVACSACHQPDLAFADDVRFSVGSQPTARNAPGLHDISRHKWFYWDGRRDSLWSQAITPIETPGEMDNNRVNAVRYVTQHPQYGPAFAALGATVPKLQKPWPGDAGAGPFGTTEQKNAWYQLTPSDQKQINQAFADIGKILAAYMETLNSTPSRFDYFVAALNASDEAQADEVLSADEQAGLKLFLDMDQTLCLRCHNGPTFTNFGFQNIATSLGDDGRPDFGRMFGLQAANYNEFNCMGEYSDVSRNQCSELIYATTEHTDRGAFKVPGLRDIALTAPYMHDGRHTTLTEVVQFYVDGAGEEAGPSEVTPIDLTEDEVRQMAAFLESLTSVSESAD